MKTIEKLKKKLKKKLKNKRKKLEKQEEDNREICLIFERRKKTRERYLSRV
ncbi:MAG: hypothetical protein K2Z81_16615 [Cyanobacteria bacterium]|nr:hypothetical protein [Cyanobacteriota bacterium]